MSYDDTPIKFPELPKWDWSKLLKKNKYSGKIHSHEREKARRRRQIEKGIIKLKARGQNDE